MNDQKVICLGSINLDHVYKVHEFVKPGETIIAQEVSEYLGGKGANQSISLARAGCSVRHIGFVGSDGVYCRTSMEREGINCSGIKEVKERTGHAIIQVNDKGQNCILIHPGANHKFEAKSVAKVLSDLACGDVLVLQNEVSAIPDIIKFAAKRGAIIYFNAAPMTDAVQSYPLACLHTLILNEHEGEGLTGKAAPEDIISILVDRYSEIEIILTLGSAGALWVKGTNRIAVPSVKVDVVDTTAAGDTWLGYYVTGRVEKLTVEQSMLLASRAASIAVSRPGAASSIPWRHEINAVF